MASFYRPPGVYPELVPSPQAVQLGLFARVPVFIGRGQNSITTTERITKAAEGYGPDVLSYEVASVDGEYQITSVGDYPNQIRYIQGTDFEVVDVDGSPKGISWLGAKAPDDGDYYYITYKRPVDSSQYEYKLYTDANELVAVHGEETTDNEVSVAGVLALRNGAPAVGIIQLNTTSTDPDDLYAAYEDTIPILEQLDTSYCRFIVPTTCIGDGTTPSDPDIFSLFYDHISDMSNTYNRRWRALIRGIRAQTGATNSAVRQDLVTLGTSYSGTQHARRVIVVAPGEIYRVLRDPTTGVYSSTLLGGWALAAAAAGRICSDYNPSTPLTRKQVVGISTDRIFSESDMNILAGTGSVTVFSYKGANLICRHGITTDKTNANTQEISVVEVEDFIKIQTIYVLEDSFIGTPIIEGLTDTVRVVIASLLEQLILQAIIADYDSGSITVTQDDNDPRIINVFFRVKPAYPLNWIDIRFQFYTK